MQFGFLTFVNYLLVLNPFVSNLYNRNMELSSKIFDQIYELNSTEKLTLDGSNVLLITDDEIKNGETRNFKADNILQLDDTDGFLEESNSQSNQGLTILETTIENFLAKFLEPIKTLIETHQRNGIIVVIDDFIYSFGDERNLRSRFSQEDLEDFSNFIKKHPQVKFIFQNISILQLKGIVIDYDLIRFKNIMFDLELNDITMKNIDEKGLPFKNINSLHWFEINKELVNILDLDKYPSEILLLGYSETEQDNTIKGLRAADIWGNVFLKKVSEVDGFDFPNLGTLAFESYTKGRKDIKSFNISNVNAPKVNVLWLETDHPVIRLVDFKVKDTLAQVSLKSTVDYDLERSEGLQNLINCIYLELSGKSIGLLKSTNLRFDKVERLTIKNFDENFDFSQIESFENLEMLTLNISKYFEGVLPNIPLIKNLQMLVIVVESSEIDWDASFTQFEEKINHVPRLMITNLMSTGLNFDMESFKERFPFIKNLRVHDLFKLQLENSRIPPSNAS